MAGGPRAVGSRAVEHAEITEDMSMRLSYGPRNLFLADWAAAVIVDDDCEEVLDAIAFANLQLLELRHIDSRIDKRIEETYSLIRQDGEAFTPLLENSKP